VFERTEHGWFQAHVYKFDAQTSMFIVECPEHVWRAHGLDKLDAEQSVAFCERVFARHLQGASLMTNARHLRGSAWLNSQRIRCAQWWIGAERRESGYAPVVLMGDAAHTAHFAIGSGTKLALEDAIELASQFRQAGDEVVLPELLDRYQALRAVAVLRLQNAAWNAMEWFEVCGTRYCDPLEPEQFMYSLLTRSQRISHENLRLRDPGWLEGYERWLALHGAANGASGERPTTVAPRGVVAQKQPIPPMFTPFTVRGITLKNRVIVSPMAQYSAIDGVVGDYHLVHLGARAMGGAALVMAEMTCVGADARITKGCPGLYTEAQGDAWARIVDWVHTHSDAHIGLQLGHAGAKGATHLGWEGIDQPLDSGGWPLISASAQQYLLGLSDWSRAMSRADMDRVLHNFVLCTRRAVEAGFDWLELHCAHGYLLSSFISPLTNQREDAYGGVAGQPAALSAGSVRRGAHRVAAAPADVGAPVHARLGRRQHHAGRRGGDCARLQGRRRRHDRLLVGPGQQRREAGLRPHVPDAVRRPGAQRGRHRDDRGRRHQRGRPRQQHHRRRPRRPVRRRAPAPGQPGLDAHRSSTHRLQAGPLAGALPICEAAARSHLPARTRSRRPRMKPDIRNGDQSDAVAAIGAIDLSNRTVELGPGPLPNAAAPLSLRPAPRRVLVTGAARGIGSAIAQALAGAGWHVTLAGRSRAALEEVRVTLPITEGLTHDCIELDVTDAGSVAGAFAEVHAKGGALQALVNNAGAVETGPLARLPHDTWDRMLAVNLTGVFLCTQAALGPMLAARAGRIVNIASTAGQKGYAYCTAYAAAKHGVLGMTRSLALEVAAQGITVNAVCPGYTDTAVVRDGVARIVAATGREADAMATFSGSSPLQRLVHPDEVAATVRWLCADAPAAVTGQALSVSGGEVMN
jgi:NAD(P)-dependent dehydrogenase (short-subunit alcohol dehydrogenase family)